VTHDAVFYAGLLWMTILLAASVVLVVRARSTLSRIVALDMAILILAGMLALLATVQGVSYYLDAALVLALISAISTSAPARYASGEPPLS
jgi:multisubunit Na+/H+ antiporter MnhF subunit